MHPNPFRMREGSPDLPGCGEGVGGWCKVGPKAAESPLPEKLFLAHSTDSLQLRVIFLSNSNMVLLLTSTWMGSQNTSLRIFTQTKYLFWKNVAGNGERVGLCLLLAKCFAVPQSMLEMSGHTHQSRSCQANSSAALVVFLPRELPWLLRGQCS